MGVRISLHRLALLAACAAFWMASPAPGAFAVSPEEVQRVERGEDAASLVPLQRQQNQSARVVPVPPKSRVEGTLLASAVKRTDGDAPAAPEAGAGRRAPQSTEPESLSSFRWGIMALAGALAVGLLSLRCIRSRRRP